MGASQPSAASGDYQVERSLRMNAADVTYLTRTPSTKGNQRKWTWAGWVKRSDIATAAQSLFSVYASSDDAGYINFYFHNSRLRLSGWNTSYRETNAQYRDTSAWYHIVLAVDTTISNNTSGDRIKIYVNGERVTDWLTESNVSQNTEFPINKANNHGIGTNVSYTTSTHKFTGYLADVHFIDGLQLTPMAFGSFDSAGVFNPKEFAPAAPNDGTTWSGKVSTDNGSFSSGAGATKAFDGQKEKSTWAASANGGASAYVGATNLGFEGSSEVTLSCWATKIEINGDILYYSGGSDTVQTFNITDFDSFKIYGKADGSKPALYYAEVDGVVLKDGQIDATTRNNVNNDTTWSSSCSGSTESWGTHAMAFDGTGANYAYATAGGSVTFTPSSAIPFKSLRAWITRDANGGTFTLNGSTTYDPPTSGVSWVTIASNGTLTSLAWNRASSGSIGIGVKAIEIDGHVLIDDSDDNSCHLKFNNVSTNAALGTDSFSNGNWTVGNLNAKTVDYEGMMSGIGNWDDGNVSKLFDGNTGNGAEFNSGGGNAVFTPNPAISYSGNLEIYTGRTTAMAVELNDSGTDISYVGAGWTTLDTGGGTLSKMEFKNGSAGNQRFAAIRVDGSILTQIGGDKVDSFVDSPMNYGTDTGAGGEVRGNYCTLNPLDAQSAVTLKQSNLQMDSSGDGSCRGTLANPNQKWYYEATVNSGPGATTIGIHSNLVNVEAFTDDAMEYRIDNGEIYGGSGSHPGTTFGSGDTIGVAVNKADGTGTISFYKNGSHIQTRNLNSDTNNNPVVPIVRTPSSGVIDFNFGQRTFKNSAPSGYKAWCTTNLADTFSGDNVNNPSKFFDAKLYTGTGSALTLPANFSTDLSLIKRRSGTSNCVTFDRISGYANTLETPNTNALASVSMVSATTSTSYTVGTDASVNGDTSIYAHWMWDAGSSASGANNNGDINVSSGNQWVNTDAGFSITKYTGSGSDQTVGHGLGAKPEFVIIKQTNSTSGWYTVFPGHHANTHYLELNNDNALYNPISNATGDADPTNTVMPVGAADWNGSGDSYIMYAWTPIKGYSAFGTYTGNGGSQQFIHTGFAPKLLIVKRTDSDSDGNWYVLDRNRIDDGNDEIPLFFNVNDQESSGATYNYIDPWTANGFGVKAGSSLNGSSKEFVYAAFAEHPMKTARAK